MANASMNGIKSRIKSVSGTMQITKAMELVATSKLRRAREQVEHARPFFEIAEAAVNTVLSSDEAKSSVYTETREGKTLYIVLAGDRGLAGGYNANLFRLTATLCGTDPFAVLPIGKKALEYYEHRGAEIFSKDYPLIALTDVGDSFSIAKAVTDAFLSGEVAKVELVYTRFASMMSQVPMHKTLLPLALPAEERTSSVLEADSFDELLTELVPDYLGGVIHAAVAEALASESGARRASMNAANKNAGEMMDDLMLRFNRARQAVITQEITEIVSGSEAL